MNFANFKIGQRMGAGFACILALLVFIAVLGINGMATVQAKLDEITSINNVETNLVVELSAAIDDRMIALRNIVLYTEITDMQPEMARINKDQQLYNEAEEKLRKMFAESPATRPEENLLFEKARQLKEKAQPLIAKAAELGFANKNDEATEVLTVELRPIQREWRRALADLAAFERQMNLDAANDAQTTFRSTRTMVIACSALALVLGGAISWLITRGILRPIRQALKVAQTVAAGDLSSHIEVTSRDETGQLLLALREMNEGLVHIVTDVRSGTDAIASASSQIASGNQDLSTRTESRPVRWKKPRRRWRN